MAASNRPLLTASATLEENTRDALRERRSEKSRSTNTVSEAIPMSMRMVATAIAGPPMCCQMSLKLNCMVPPVGSGLEFEIDFDDAADGDVLTLQLRGRVAPLAHCQQRRFREGRFAVHQLDVFETPLGRDDDLEAHQTRLAVLAGVARVLGLWISSRGAWCGGTL